MISFEVTGVREKTENSECQGGIFLRIKFVMTYFHYLVR